MTPAQYEAIEETSYDPDTLRYSVQFRLSIRDQGIEGKLFSDGLNAIEVDLSVTQGHAVGEFVIIRRRDLSRDDGHSLV